VRPQSQKYDGTDDEKYITLYSPLSTNSQ